MALREGPLPSPHPLCGSPWAVSFVVLDTPGVHGAEEGTHDCLSTKLFGKDEDLVLTLTVSIYVSNCGM